MNQKGQEGAGFRLLIEAVLVVFILVIILGVISQVDEWRWKVSERRLFEGFTNSLDSPDGSVIYEKDIVLKDGSMYSSSAFANTVSGIDSDCIKIEASDSTAFAVSNDKVIQIRTLIQTDLYYKCFPGHLIGVSNCRDYCIISFGKDLAE